jgi:hypothetical protein
MLLCTTADTWSLKMVPCPFSRSTKKQLSASVRNRECHSLNNGKTSSSAKNETNPLAKCFRWSCTMLFLFLSPLERKAMWVSISVDWGDHHWHKGSCTGPSCKYLSAVFPAAIPTLADLHSSQWWLFWGRIWICGSVVVKALCCKPEGREFASWLGGLFKLT